MAVELDEYLLEQQVVEQIRGSRHRIDEELSKVIVGQAGVVEQLLISLFAGGHCLITGAPGLAKTLLVRSISQVFHLNFQRIQFTPDLMPADITGTEILEQASDGHRRMQFVKGPIFGNVILADEINRTPPKTRAALPEAPEFINDWVAWGAGTRAAQYVVLGAKARALLAGRNHAGIEDIRALAAPTFRHRILVGYRAEAEGISVEQVISRLLETVTPPAAK